MTTQQLEQLIKFFEDTLIQHSNTRKDIDNAYNTAKETVNEWIKKENIQVTEKPITTQQENQLYVLFGKENIVNYGFMNITEDMKNALSSPKFQTEEEAKAYIYGLESLDGWNDYIVLTTEQANKILNHKP